MMIPVRSISKASFPPSSDPQLHSFDGYEILSLSTSTNRVYAQQENASYMISLSGGLGSAIAAERAIRRYGRAQCALWFADVMKEDEDLYRFLHDLMRRWRGRLYWFRSGMRPEDIWERHGIIPNNRMCPCSFEMKVKYFREFITAMSVLPQVFLGYKKDEKMRQVRTCASYAQAIPHCRIEYPLTWEPVERRDLSRVCVEELEIAPPRVYAQGFAYNNCGSDCCRSGIGGRILEAIFYPERYQQAMKWEEMMREKGGSLTGKAFCARVVHGKKVPLPLHQILHEYVPLARAYLDAHPHQQVSEKTLVREMKKWQRKEQGAQQDKISYTRKRVREETR